MELWENKKTALHGDLHCVGPVVRLQFADHVFHMALYRFFCNGQAITHTLVRITGGNQA
jgi:hypothetical protein